MTFLRAPINKTALRQTGRGGVRADLDSTPWIQIHAPQTVPIGPTGRADS